LKLTEDEYIDYLLNLKKYEEMEILNVTLKANTFIFKMIESEILLKMKEKEDMIKNNERNDEIINTEKSLHMKNAEITITESKLPNPKSFKEEYKQRILPKVSTDQITQPTLGVPQKYIIRNTCTVYDYIELCSLIEGNIFGEKTLLLHDSKRNASVILDEECYLGSVDQITFNLTLKSCFKKHQNDYMKYLVSLDLFSGLKDISFYVNNFNYFKFQKNDIIIKTNTILNKAYFFREGEYLLYLDISLNELTKMLNKLEGNPETEKTAKEEEYELFKRTHFHTFSNKIQRLNILTIQSEMLGFGELLINNVYFCNIKCISKKGFAYSLHHSVNIIM